MRAMSAIALAAVLGGCVTTRVMQRDGCWVRETKKTLRGKTEELGPCTRPAPQWSEDRLTRLVQECVAQADHRWSGRAVDAWNRKQPLPPQERQEDVIRACMDQAATSSVAQNETLRERLAEVSSDRESLRAETAETEAHLRQSHDRIAEWLGEAAKRPPPVATATATATSDGMATTENGFQSETGTSSQATPAAAPVVSADTPAPPAAPEAKPASSALKTLQQARAARKARTRTASGMGCDAPAASPATAAQGEEAAAPSARAEAAGPTIPAGN